jgi:shikimate kinase
MIKTGKLCILREMQQEYRKVIWVTANFETDMRYAERSPELVSEAIRNEYTRLHYRRKNVLDEANEIVLKGIAWFGEPKVVILNAKKIGATGGHNEPTKSYISSDAIEKIVIRLFKQNQL